jgi:hypothetical protein
MAVNTIRDGAVGISMTEITGKGFVLARTGDHLLVWTGMAGDTDRLVLTIKVNIQRLMRVVTTEAVFNFVVGTAFMTIITVGDVVFRARAMPFMAGLAINFRLVGCTVCSDLCRLFIVTFDTV